jgi:WD40 repeat protein
VERELVFAGDKSGHLGILLASHEPAKAEDDYEEVELSTYTFRAHAKSSISCIRLAPNNSHTLYTSGYDCTLRSLNFETGNTTEIVDADLLAAEDYGEDEALLSAFDMASNGNELWSTFRCFCSRTI